MRYFRQPKPTDAERQTEGCMKLKIRQGNVDLWRLRDWAGYNTARDCLEATQGEL